MTSSDCLSSNNLHPRLSSITRLNLPVPSIHNVPNDLKKSSSFTTTPTSTSPHNFHTPTATIPARFPHPNMFPYPRQPPPAPVLLRKHIEFKPPEQEILDRTFIHTFNMEEKNVSNKTSESTINTGNNI
jgi:hypothetical protein